MFNRLRFKNGCLKAFTLSYDDGCRTDPQLIEIMKKYGIKGTFNLNASMFYETEPERIAAAEARKQAYLDPGIEVACHGEWHLHLEDLTYPQMVKEIMTDRERLEKEFGVFVRGMAYAYGTTTEDAMDFMKKCGICYSRTVGRKEDFNLPKDWLRIVPNCHHDDEMLFDMAERFLAETDEPKKQPMLFYVWGHSAEFERYNNWDRIEKLLELVSGKPDVWYATNIEIYDYVQAYNSLIFSLDGLKVHNPTSTDVWFTSFYNKTYKVSAGETIVLD